MGDRSEDTQIVTPPVGPLSGLLYTTNSWYRRRIDVGREGMSTAGDSLGLIVRRTAEDVRDKLRPYADVHCTITAEDYCIAVTCDETQSVTLTLSSNGTMSIAQTITDPATSETTVDVYWTRPLIPDRRALAFLLIERYAESMRGIQYGNLYADLNGDADFVDMHEEVNAGFEAAIAAAAAVITQIDSCVPGIGWVRQLAKQVIQGGDTGPNPDRNEWLEGKGFTPDWFEQHGFTLGWFEQSGLRFGRRTDNDEPAPGESRSHLVADEANQDLERRNLMRRAVAQVRHHLDDAEVAHTLSGGRIDLTSYETLGIALRLTPTGMLTLERTDRGSARTIQWSDRPFVHDERALAFLLLDARVSNLSDINDALDDAADDDTCDAIWDDLVSSREAVLSAADAVLNDMYPSTPAHTWVIEDAWERMDDDTFESTGQLPPTFTSQTDTKTRNGNSNGITRTRPSLRPAPSTPAECMRVAADFLGDGLPTANVIPSVLGGTLIGVWCAPTVAVALTRNPESNRMSISWIHVDPHTLTIDDEIALLEPTSFIADQHLLAYCVLRAYIRLLESMQGLSHLDKSLVDPHAIDEDLDAAYELTNELRTILDRRYRDPYQQDVYSLISEMEM